MVLLSTAIDVGRETNRAGRGGCESLSDLLQKGEQHHFELRKAREACSEHAQRLREHRAAEAARSVEHSKLKADMTERAEVVASMAAAAALSVDDIDETVRLQRQVLVLEEQLATGRQAAVASHAAGTSTIQIELERVEAENRGLQDELATLQQRRVRQRQSLGRQLQPEQLES